MTMRAIAALLAYVLLAGCAANLTKEEPATALQVPTAAKSHLIVNFKGSSQVSANPDWARLKSAWRAALQSEASTYGYAVTEQAGQIATGSSPGLLLVISVNDFRYVTESKRAAFGFWTGNAWVDAKVAYIDAQTGQAYGDRSYNTSSSAWEGVFSAMTDVQVQAIAKDMVDEIRNAKTAAASVAPVSASAQGAIAREQSKQQQLEQLNREGLSYEEYQRRYREITAQ